MQLGARWEYETPLSESLGRLANLSVTPGFTSAASVVGDGLIAYVLAGAVVDLPARFLDHTQHHDYAAAGLQLVAR